MKTGLIATLSGLGVVAMVAVVCLGSYVSAYNYGAKMDSQLDAEYSQMKNVLGQYSLKVVEAAGVTDMMKADVVEVVSAAMSGRYGEEGSQASWQFIKEQNPSVAPEIYVKVQQIIEAGRNDFSNSQKRFIDSRRQYKEALDTFWKGTWLGVAGRPKTALSEYKLIESQHGKETFETGTDTAIKLR